MEACMFNLGRGVDPNAVEDGSSVAIIIIADTFFFFFPIISSRRPFN